MSSPDPSSTLQPPPRGGVEAAALGAPLGVSPSVGPSSPTWMDCPHLHYLHNSFPPPPPSSPAFHLGSLFLSESSSPSGACERSSPASAPPRIAVICPPPSLLYRTIQPSDLGVLQALHEALFPIRYEPEFFTSVVYGRGIVSWAAVDAASPDGLVGFVTARVASINESEEVDLLGYELGQSERQVIYILTLGVTQPYRKLGIASMLIGKVLDYAASCPSCRAVYLHVIAYNHAAILLYKKNRFQCLRRLSEFYFIGGSLYDAYLYVYYVNGGRRPFSTTDIVGSAGSFLRSFVAVVERLLFSPRAEGDEKRRRRRRRAATWPLLRAGDLWAALFGRTALPCGEAAAAPCV